MRRSLALPGLVLLLCLAATLVPGCGAGPEAAVKYRCPMHPTFVADGPGTCAICGMSLVPVSAPAAAAVAPSAGTGPVVAGHAPVELDPAAIELAGIRTAAATRATIAHSVRAAGVVVPDERRVSHFHTRVGGWVEKLHVNYAGQLVRRGDPVLTVYSPELLASQQEFLRLREAASRLTDAELPGARQAAEEMLAAARLRLRLFDVPESFLDEIEATGVPSRTVTLLAHAPGFVTVKEVYEGEQVEPGQDLFTVADLSRVWVEAHIYELELAHVQVGQEARISLPGDPGGELRGRVSFIEPFFDPATRTVTVRLEIPNPGLRLRPEMYVDVALAGEGGTGVAVPEDAVMDTGTRQIVYVERTPGRFEPREVAIGVRSGGLVQVLSGVAEGERVVIAANFLLDSESRLRAATAGELPRHEHGAAPAATPGETGPGHEHGGARP